MNRLVLIGNGFDLSHGLKTSYRDFIEDYLYRSLMIFLRQGKFEDNNILITYIERYYYMTQEFIELFEQVENKMHVIQQILRNNMIMFEKKNRSYHNVIKVKFINPFLDVLMKKMNTNEFKWVDIENEYYKELITFAKAGKIEAIKTLNDGLDLIKKELENYLHNLPAVNLLPSQWKQLKDTLDLDETDKILFLTFNYTPTLQQYHLPIKDMEIIHIHGETKSSPNPIIFGFGDEMDDEYKTLEKLNDNCALENIKSFGYFLNDNYTRLIDFIRLGKFKVNILGHSCGLSDRIMLNTIFEHQNCEQIEINYFENAGGNNFKELTQNISRHFNKKALMRDRVLPFVDCRPMIQYPA